MVGGWVVKMPISESESESESESDYSRVESGPVGSLTSASAEKTPNKIVAFETIVLNQIGIEVERSLRIDVSVQ